MNLVSFDQFLEIYFFFPHISKIFLKFCSLALDEFQLNIYTVKEM